MNDETLRKAEQVVQGNPGALAVVRALLQRPRADEIIDRLHRDGPKGTVLHSVYRGGAWTRDFDSFDDWVLGRSGA